MIHAVVKIIDNEVIEDRGTDIEELLSIVKEMCIRDRDLPDMQILEDCQKIKSPG